MFRPRAHRLRFESLESRLVLDARLVITELVASNDKGLEDEDGDRPDWIEIYNDGDADAALSGWFLTDDADEPDKWAFPDVSLAPRQYLVVFASGKDRADMARPLHANFRLSSGGEYLALVEPNGRTVTQEYAPSYPPQRTDTAFGQPQGLSETTLIGQNAGVRVFVPSEDNGGSTIDDAWTHVGFDDSDWTEGTSGVGYETISGFEDLIGTDVGSGMLDVHPTVYIRSPFTVDRPTSVFSLVLRMKYDDGYVATLNGVEVARRNAPDSLGWDSPATATHRDSLAVEFEDVDITAHIGQLVVGGNVLAIQGLNSSAASNDFLIVPVLIASQPAALEPGSSRFFARPTPGGPNGEVSFAGFVAPTAVSVGRGFYDEPLDLILTTETLGATVVYSTDGSVPSLDNGKVVAALDSLTPPIATVGVATTTTLRVAAFKEDFLPSKTQTYSYIFADDVVAQDHQATLDAGFPEMWLHISPDYGIDPQVAGPGDLFDGRYADQLSDALKSVPTLSIAMDIDDMFGEQGIYTNPSKEGRDWERATSVELISPDGSVDFQVDAGIRIAGGSSRDHAATKKKSFRLVFRSEFGPTKLEFPLFGSDAADRFDTIVLRNNYNDAWQWSAAEGKAQYLRDQWLRAAQLAMGQPSAHGTFVHLYINGIYWGLYNPVERPEASFSATYLGGDKSEWDALNTGNVVNGSDQAWQELLRLANGVNTRDQQASNAALLRLLGNSPDGTRNPEYEVLLDVENMIDYMILNFYAGNTDWPRRNWYVARRRGPESTGFQFYSWDGEWTLNFRSDVNTNRTGVDDSVAQIYADLRRNEEFQLWFADRVHKHFFNGGTLFVDLEQPEWDPAHPETSAPAALYRQLADQIDSALIAESARWGDQHRELPYTLADWQAERDDLLAHYFPQRSRIVLSQLISTGLYPRLAAPVFSPHGGNIASEFRLTIDAAGDIYYTLDGNDPRQSRLEEGVAESGPSATAIQYAGPITLSRETVVKARTWSDGQWSALNEAEFSTEPADVDDLRPGDANLDGVFDGTDLALVVQAGKYLTGEPATVDEGDWNHDGVFDQLDIVGVLQIGHYTTQ